jgi:hypothetical protein
MDRFRWCPSESAGSSSLISFSAYWIESWLMSFRYGERNEVKSSFKEEAGIVIVVFMMLFGCMFTHIFKTTIPRTLFPCEQVSIVQERLI